MTLRRKILLATVLALVPVAALLRWNHRGRAFCDGVARATSAFAENLEATGDFVVSLDEATDAFAKRQDILGARRIERGKWRIRVSQPMNGSQCQALRVWHQGKRVMDNLDEMWSEYAVEFPELPGHPASGSTKDDPRAFALSYQGPYAGIRRPVWLVSPVGFLEFEDCEVFRWAPLAGSVALLLEARHRINTVVANWFCWVVYRIDPLAGVQLLAEDNRLPEPSEEWVQFQIARNPGGPYVDLHETVTQLLVNGQWRAVGTLARRLRWTSTSKAWAALIDETIRELESNDSRFTPMFNTYRAEMGTPWHEPGASARKPAAVSVPQ